MVQATLYLLHYNNYYNRIVKKETSLSDYQEYLIGQPIQGVNFIPNDYVNTTQIVNWDYDNPDYLVVVDEDQNINSRWFVISTNRTRAGQLNLELHRDLVVDYYDGIVSAPMFVEKAIIPDDNNLIFNSENMSFNQIKQSETLLKDQSGCPWIVIYAASKNAEGADTSFSGSFQDDFEADYSFSSESEWNSSVIGQLFNGLVYANDIKLTNIKLPVGKNNASLQEMNITKTSFSTTNWGSSTANWFIGNHTYNEAASAFQSKWSNIENGIKSTLTYYNPTSYSDVFQYNNSIIKVPISSTEFTYYKVKINTGTRINYPNARGKIYEDYLEPCMNFGTIQTGTVNNISLYITEDIVEAEFTEIEPNTYKYNIPAGRSHLSDAPYDIFCIPYSDSLVIKNVSETNFVQTTSSKRIAMLTARSLITTYAGSNTIYDAQILPYCPLVSGTATSTSFDIGVSSTHYTTININDSDSTVIGYILYAQVSSFTRQINLDTPINIQNYKLESECDIYRLCSPNYNGVFEFNAAKNDGIQYFTISCTYKPFTPYIKIYPNFKRLYGSDFNDQRGLVCGGDFSLPMTTSAWATYELQNKNYQNSFDRQIQNMEISNDVQREQQLWNIAVGTISGAGTGAISGSIFGGIGTGVGAVVGGTASLAGGIRDYQLSEKLRNEAIDYTKDQFGYQLGNIKALPQSLSKVSAYNVDNKYFPFLEYYTCSDVEKKALANKIIYNGMTTMAIGTINDYIYNEWNYNGVPAKKYIKGKLIRLEGIDENYHIINAIADELYKGVYLQ